MLECLNWLVEQPLQEGICVVDADYQIRHWNEMAEKITGYSSHDVVGKYAHDDLINPIDEEGIQLCLNFPTIPEGKSYVEKKVFIQHRLGYRVLTIMRFIPWTDSQGKEGFLKVFTPLKPMDSSYIAPVEIRDAITQLINPTFGKMMLQGLIERHFKTHVPFGVMILDVDNFDFYNNTYGRHVGDAVLHVVSSTLRHSFFQADYLIRFGADEMLLIYNNVSSNRLKEIGEKLRIVLEHTALRGHAYKAVDMTVSIGGTLVRPRDTSDVMLERTLAFLKKAKSKGGNRCQIS